MLAHNGTYWYRAKENKCVACIVNTVVDKSQAHNLGVHYQGPKTLGP